MAYHALDTPELPGMTTKSVTQTGAWFTLSNQQYRKNRTKKAVEKQADQTHGFDTQHARAA